MKAIRNKIYGIGLILIGVLSAILMEGDITALIILSLIGIPLLFARENWIYQIKRKP